MLYLNKIHINLTLLKLLVMIKIIDKNTPEIMHIILDLVANNMSNNEFGVDFEIVEDKMRVLATNNKSEVISCLDFYKVKCQHDLEENDFLTILLYASSILGMYLEMKQGVYEENKKKREGPLLVRHDSPPLEAYFRKKEIKYSTRSYGLLFE